MNSPLILKNLSIRYKIIGIVLLVVFVSMLVGFIFIASWDITRLKKDTQSSLILSTKLIGDYCVVPLYFGDSKQASEALSRLKFHESIESGYLFDADGAIFASYPDSIGNNILPIVNNSSSAVHIDGYFYISEPVFFQEKLLGIICIKANSKILEMQKQKLATVLPLLMIVLIFLSFLMATKMQKLISEPIIKLAELTASISKHQDFTVQIKPIANDEVGVLYNQFNDLLSQLLKRQIERDKAEEDLKESEKKYRLIVDAANEGIWTLDKDFKTTFVNAKMAELLGYEDKELMIGLSFTDFMFKEDFPDHFKKVIDRFSGVSSNYERCFKRKDGQKVWTLVSGTSIVDEENNFIGTVGMVTDITERRYAEELLRKNESQLSAIFNTISDILYFVAVEPNDKYNFIAVNEMFLKATGLKKEQVVNKAVNEVIPQPAIELVIEKYREAIETKQTVFWEEVSEYPTGKKYGVVKITPTFNEFEVCINLVGSVHDITSIRESENEILELNAALENRVIERTAQLESTNKELESFSYSVSHDLRAPLRHVNGYLELLIKRNSQQLDDKGKHYIQSISEASNHMGKLIDDLLNFSRTGRTEMKFDNIDMNRVIKDALAILEPETKGRTIEWITAPMPNVYADYAMMRQVWINLISNALKYSRKREIAHIEIGLSTNTNENLFFVSDNGAGFDMKYAQKLFGVFQRLHATDEFEGTGIGLANVRQVIKRHNGRTWAEGEIDKGATFYFSLPKIEET